jgi:Ca2+-binding RTX toxin-like protein
LPKEQAEDRVRKQRAGRRDVMRNVGRGILVVWAVGSLVAFGTLSTVAQEQPYPLPECNEIHGTSGDDELTGTHGRDCIFGEGGDDLIVAKSGDDEIKGGGGDDRMKGRLGDDDLIGGGGDQDVAKGGRGDDSCSAETEVSC